MDEMTIERLEDAAGALQGLKVAGSLTVAQAATFREALLDMLSETKGEFTVDVSAVSSLDLSGLQLLCSAHQSACKNGRRLQVVDGGNQAFRGVVADAGFQRHIGCARDTTNSCIWVGGDN